MGNYGLPIENYVPGDEKAIVELLNACFGDWGSEEEWKWRYTLFPGSLPKHVFVIRDGDAIVAHRGLRLREMIIGSSQVTTATNADVAVHPSKRKLGLYRELHGLMLRQAKMDGACLALNWVLNGSTTHRTHKKAGFIEIDESPVYVKIINPSALAEAALRDLLHKNQRLCKKIASMRCDIGITVGCNSISIKALTGLNLTRPRSIMEVRIGEDCVSELGSFRNQNTARRLMTLFRLLLNGKVRVSFSSLVAVRDFAREVFSLLACL